jgi:4-amino-4-deoxy-L-arabinose transferase-like glycosyltransferase
MFSPLALIFIPLGYVFLWPLIDVAQKRWRGASSPLETGLLTVALSHSLLALILMWIGLLPGALVTGLAALVIVVGFAVLGLVVKPQGFAPGRWSTYWIGVWQQIRRLDGASLVLWMLIGALWIMLIHSLYYPFIGEDTLTRYALHAKLIYLEHRIPMEVWGYPPLTALTWAATWFAAGQVNEHLARVYSVVMAAGTIGSTYLLAREIGGRKLALIAVVVLIATPMFFWNSTIDYVDVPSAFLLTLGLYFAVQWWKRVAVYDAVMVGILFGMALLTKQSAFTWFASFGAVPVLWLLAARKYAVAFRWKRAGRGLAGMIIPALLIAGPWYIRNIQIGTIVNIIPVAGEYHLLGRGTGVLGMIPAAGWPTDFGPWLVPIYVIGWGIGLTLAMWRGIRTLRGTADNMPAETMPYDLLLGVAVVPYWLAWWSKFSFEARFLILILPLMAIWAARPVQSVLEAMAEMIQRVPVRAVRLVVGVFLLGLLLLSARERLGAVYHALTRPFWPESERFRYTKGEVYDLVEYIRTHFEPDQYRLVSIDARLPYYLPEYHIDVAYPRHLRDLEGYDYIIYSSSMTAIYSSDLGWRTSEFYKRIYKIEYFEPVFESQGVYIMKIMRTTVSSEKN